MPPEGYDYEFSAEDEDSDVNNDEAAERDAAENDDGGSVASNNY